MHTWRIFHFVHYVILWLYGVIVIYSSIKSGSTCQGGREGVENRVIRSNTRIYFALFLASILAQYCVQYLYKTTSARAAVESKTIHVHRWKKKGCQITHTHTLIMDSHWSTKNFHILIVGFPYAHLTLSLPSVLF